MNESETIALSRCVVKWMCLFTLLLKSSACTYTLINQFSLLFIAVIFQHVKFIFNYTLKSQTSSGVRWKVLHTKKYYFLISKSVRLVLNTRPKCCYFHQEIRKTLAVSKALFLRHLFAKKNVFLKLLQICKEFI